MAVADTWKVVPVVTLILLAGLQAIPVEVEEAARADGATGWRWLLHVVLPLLAPYMTVAVILRAIDAFRIFEVALILAGRVEPVLGTFIWSRYAPPVERSLHRGRRLPWSSSSSSWPSCALYLGLVAREGERCWRDGGPRRWISAGAASRRGEAALRGLGGGLRGRGPVSDLRPARWSRWPRGRRSSASGLP